MFNNKGRRRKFRSNSNRPFRRRHNGEGRGSNSPNAIMNGQFRQNSFKGPYNTAKLMEDNSMLFKLKEMEYVEKIADKIGEITVAGNGNVIEQLKDIFSVNK
mgnify:CR=1 FL=1